MAITTDEFQTFANSFGFGYCKEWKASSIVYELNRQEREGRSIVTVNRERLESYIRNCLEMEGFRTGDCVKICDWIEERI